METFSLKALLVSSLASVLVQSSSYAQYDWRSYSKEDYWPHSYEQKNSYGADSKQESRNYYESKA